MDAAGTRTARVLYGAGIGGGTCQFLVNCPDIHRREHNSTIHVQVFVADTIGVHERAGLIG